MLLVNESKGGGTDAIQKCFLKLNPLVHSKDLTAKQRVRLLCLEEIRNHERQVMKKQTQKDFVQPEMLLSPVSQAMQG